MALLAPGVDRAATAPWAASPSAARRSPRTAVYINGLNVTDFYNRIGFSSVPFAFYQEFQVKTGGYSVEFGRTTGGVINAVTRSGTNEFKYGAELLWEPDWMQSEAKNRYDDGGLYYAASDDEYDRTSLNLYASGPIVKDKLFFFAHVRSARLPAAPTPTTTARCCSTATATTASGARKFDWQIIDNHLLELLAFSDENEVVTDQYRYDLRVRRPAATSSTRIYRRDRRQQLGADLLRAT